MSSVLPLKANDDVCAGTCRPLICVKAVLRSSVIPSLKYSFSLSALMFTNGRTATDFAAGAAAGVNVDLAKRDQAQSPMAAMTMNAAAKTNGLLLRFAAGTVR